jgi:hypothetical protein
MPNEVTLVVRGVKDEHVAWTVRALFLLTGFLKLDGTELDFDMSVERNHDGVERIHEYIEEALVR